MLNYFFPSFGLWQTITHFGEAGLILPVSLIVGLGFGLSRQHSALRVWVLALGAAIALTLFSKILFLGWGIGIAALSFTGISGHTVLASAVLPVFANCAFAARPGLSRLGVALGVVLSIGVGCSRVVLGAHTPSEVIAGWCIGGAVALATLWALRNDPYRGPRLAVLFVPLIALAANQSLAGYLPTAQWEYSLAQFLSGHATPFLR